MRSGRASSGPTRGLSVQTILLDNKAYVVIGVMPADSAFDRGAAQLWQPLAFRPFNMTWEYRWLNVSFARLKPGVSL